MSNLGTLTTKLYKELVNNSMAGASIMSDGKIPKSGFALSIDPDFEEKTDVLNFHVLVTYASKVEKFLNKSVDKGIGIWFNESEGMFYLDVITVKKSINEAITLAKMNNQLAIFHLNTKQEIKIV